MSMVRLVSLAALALALIAGCGGGGGGGGGSTEVVTGPLVPDPQRVEFDEVLLGDSAQADLTLRNVSADAPITITSISFVGDGLDGSMPALPLILAPGAETKITLVYTAAVLGPFDGRVSILHQDPDGALDVPVTAGISGREIVDFGSQGLGFSGSTALLDVEVPADAISLTLEGLMSDGARIDLEDLFGPGGRIYVENRSSGPYEAGSKTEAFSTTVPNTDRSSVQLVEGGGTYSFRLRRVSGSGSQMQVRAIIQRRTASTTGLGTLDLNVWLADALAPNAATAANDSRLQRVLAKLGSDLAQQGIFVGDITYYDVNDPAYDDVSEAEFPEALKITSRAADVRVNLFYVRSVFESGVIGAAGTVSGPYRNGTRMSGLMVRYSNTLGTTTLGDVSAHEIGHLLGLEHTVDSDGSHDDIEDTPECPALGTDEECSIAGGDLLMNWQYLGGQLITDGQGLVLRAHPFVGPAYPGGQGPSLLLLPAAEDAVDELPAGWCGSCGR